MQQSKKVNVRYITFTAVMAALVFVFTFTFKIPLGNRRLHPPGRYDDLPGRLAAGRQKGSPRRPFGRLPG